MSSILAAINLIFICGYLYVNRDHIWICIVDARDFVLSKIVHYFGDIICVSKTKDFGRDWRYSGSFSFSNTLNGGYGFSISSILTTSSITSSSTITGNQNLTLSNGTSSISVNELIAMKNELQALKQDHLSTKYDHSLRINDLENKE